MSNAAAYKKAQRTYDSMEPPEPEMDDEEVSRQYDLEDEIANLCWQYWKSLPYPKRAYVDWYYGKGGVQDAIRDTEIRVREGETR